MDSIVIGIIVSVAGNSVVALSLNAQKLAHNRNVNGTSYLKLPMWWVGMLLMAFGEVGNFVAYGFAPAVVVAPLGAVSVVINGLLGKFCKFLDEQVRLRDAFGYLLAIGGAVMFVFFSPHSEDEISPEDLVKYVIDIIFLIYFGCLMVLLVVVFVLSKKYAKKTSVIYLAICSILGSITVMATKAISTFVRLIFSGVNIFTDWVTYVLIIVIITTTTLQMRYLNMAMENFGATEVVPVYYVMFTGFSILSGGILYHEFQMMSAQELGLFAVGCFVTFSGVYFITSKRAKLTDGQRLADLQSGSVPSVPSDAGQSADVDHHYTKYSDHTSGSQPMHHRRQSRLSIKIDGFQPISLTEDSDSARNSPTPTSPATSDGSFSSDPLIQPLTGSGQVTLTATTSNTDRRPPRRSILKHPGEGRPKTHMSAISFSLPEKGFLGVQTDSNFGRPKEDGDVSLALDDVEMQPMRDQQQQRPSVHSRGASELGTSPPTSSQPSTPRLARSNSLFIRPVSATEFVLQTQTGEEVSSPVPVAIHKGRRDGTFVMESKGGQVPVRVRRRSVMGSFLIPILDQDENYEVDMAVVETQTQQTRNVGSYLESQPTPRTNSSSQLPSVTTIH